VKESEGEGDKRNLDKVVIKKGRGGEL